MLGQFRLHILVGDWRPGGTVKIVSQPSEAVVRGRDLHHDPLTFRIAYFGGDCPSFFCTVQPISFVPYELRGRLSHGLNTPKERPSLPKV